MTPLPANPFIIVHETRFTLDEKRFFAAIEPAPKFLRDPSPEYLTAIELIPIVKVLTAYR